MVVPLGAALKALDERLVVELLELDIPPAQLAVEASRGRGA